MSSVYAGEICIDTKDKRKITWSNNGQEKKWKTKNGEKIWYWHE